MKKVMPHNFESEKIILGSMIADNKQIADLLVILHQSYFYNKENEVIFSIIKRLYQSNNPVDTVTIYESTIQQKLNIKAATINTLADYATDLSYSSYHAYLITEKFILRNLITRSSEIIEHAYRQEEDVFDLVRGSLSNLEQTLEIQEEVKEDKNLFDKLPEIFDNIRDEREGIISESIKFADHPSVNDCTGGIRNGNLIVISGNAKQGKTSFGVSMMLDLACEKKHKIGWFSLEVNEYEMDLKFISMATETRYGYLRNPKDKNKYKEFRYTDQALMDTVSTAMRRFNGTEIYINDSDLDIFKIINKIKLWKKKKGIEIVAIDYIGLIESKTKSERRDLEIAELSRKLKRTALQLNIPIFILSQENEEGKTADSKALIRDADFWFSCVNLKDAGKDYFRWHNGISEQRLPVDNSYFEVKNKGNRHAPAGKRMLYRYFPNATYREVDYEHSENII